MRRPFLLSAVLAWSMLLRGEACGTEVGNKGIGEPCTRDSECLDGLECAAGTCREPREDAGRDSGGPPVDSGATSDASISDSGA